MDSLIKWFDISDMSPEEFDKLDLQRFNIKNFDGFANNYELKNFYAFKVLDLDKNSKTHYYGMCINKEYASKVMKLMDEYKANKHYNKSKV